MKVNSEQYNIADYNPQQFDDFYSPRLGLNPHGRKVILIPVGGAGLMAKSVTFHTISSPQGYSNLYRDKGVAAHILDVFSIQNVTNLYNYDSDQLGFDIPNNATAIECSFGVRKVNYTVTATDNNYLNHDFVLTNQGIGTSVISYTITYELED